MDPDADGIVSRSGVNVTDADHSLRCSPSYHVQRKPAGNGADRFVDMWPFAANRAFLLACPVAEDKRIPRSGDVMR